MALACAAAACRSEPPRPHDVVLIVVDTLRADRLGVAGHARAHTPVLDALAARGARFTHAYAPSSWTMPSIASLFTARLPSQHLVGSFDSRLPDAERTLAERLAAAGFANGGFTANWRLKEDLGFAQGFRTWRGLMVDGKTRGDVVREAAFRWLNAALPGGGPPGPRLLYLQYMEPHLPFEPPAALRARFAPGVSAAAATQLNTEALARLTEMTPVDAEQARTLAALYDGEVAAVDVQIGRLLEGLRRRGILEHALVIVTADHGEEFLEHGHFGHGYNLFDPSVRVPLLLAGPGVPAGTVVRTPVSLIDVAPTVLDLLGLPPEPSFEGRSLVPLLHDDDDGADLVLQLPRNDAAWDLRVHSEGLVRGARKLLVDPRGRGELFDLDDDPGELAPLAPPAAAALQSALAAKAADLATRQQPEAQKAVVDEATKEKLRALGYHH